MKVAIKNKAGKYLSSDRGEIIFVNRLKRAFIYDYEEDKVEEQLETVKSQLGFTWSWEDVGDADGLLCLPKKPYRTKTSPNYIQS